MGNPRTTGRKIDEASAAHAEPESLTSAALKAVLSITSERILVQDADGRFIHVSEPFAWSFAARSRDMEGRRWQDLGPIEGVIDKLEELRIDALSSGRESTLEAPLGSSPYAFTAAPLSNGRGGFDGTVMVAQDLSERVETKEHGETEGKHSNERLGTGGAVLVKDLEGRYTMVDPAGVRLFGRPREEILGATDAELFDDAESVLTTMESDRRTILSGKGQRFRQTMRMANGAREFLVDKMPNVDAKGRIIGIIVILQDITEQKDLERSLQARGEWLASLIEKSPVAIGVSRNWHVTFANSRYLRMFGYESMGEIISQPIAGHIAPEDRRRILESVQRMWQKPVELEMIGLRKDGSRFPVQAAIAAVDLPDGPALLGFFTDITERRRLEKKLAEARSRAELYVDLLTHDISNYNAAAIGYLQLAEARLDLDDKEIKFISSPLQVLADSSELIANIRDLQKVEAGRERPEPIDVYRILREVKEAYEHPPGRQVEIVLHEAGGCMVMASGLIRGAFSNIVSNAIKHSDGDLQVRIAVSMVSRQGKRYVRVSIEDTGPGISDERKATIFDRSLMGLTKPVSRGLGLYLVKKLVEDFDGEVWVEDRVPGEPSKGAKFVVLLPAAEGWE